MKPFFVRKEYDAYKDETELQKKIRRTGTVER